VDQNCILTGGKGNRSIPSLKLLLNLLGTWRMYLILPVPVVFRLMAFTLQLSVFKNKLRLTLVLMRSKK
jgi:hypothetical protein